MIQVSGTGSIFSVDLSSDSNPTTQADVSPSDMLHRRACEVDDNGIHNVAKDLKRLERQTNSTPTKLGYQFLGGIYEFGRNFVDQFEGEPFKIVKSDLDMLFLQSESIIAKVGIGTIGVFYGFGSTAFKLPSDLALGAVTFLADIPTAIAALPSYAMHNSQEILSGILDLCEGRVSSGTARIATGVTSDWMLFEGGRLAIKSAPSLYGAYANGVNELLDITRPQVPNTPFNNWMRKTTPGSSRGAIEVPTGFQQIPGGKFRGETLSPFVMKETPVTNAQWLQGIEGQKRIVTLRFDPNSDIVEIVDISSKPPATLSPLINLDTGRIVVDGTQILLKLVDNPSAFYDVGGRVFSEAAQPIINVTKFHVLTWLQVQRLWVSGNRVYRLPTDFQFEFVASDRGIKLYATENGELYATGGRRLAHFDDRMTISVDAHRYEQQLPFGVQAIGNVWRWTEFNPLEECPNGIRAGSWSVFDPTQMRAAFRNDYSANFRYYDVGFQPVFY